MRFSKEELYFQFGQYDRVIGISFETDSESYNKFGDFIVGKLIYTPKEREELHNTINSKETIPRTDGQQRFFENIKKIPVEKRNELERYGFLCSDISLVQFMNVPSDNEYVREEIRELPEPIKLNISSNFSAEETANLIIHYSESLIKSEYELTPFEWDEYNGAIWYNYPESIPEKVLKTTFYKPDTEELKDEIKFQYLNLKFECDELTEPELKEFEELFQNMLRERLNALEKELLSSTGNLKNLKDKYSKEFLYVYSMVTYFKPYRILHGKHPVYLNFERFLHIYLRHVSETQIGEHFENKSVFQYKHKDIENVIKYVLESINDEIQEHFETNPSKEFKRHGSRSVYYKGDYYVVNIDGKGCLMNLYKMN